MHRGVAIRSSRSRKPLGGSGHSARRLIFAAAAVVFAWLSLLGTAYLFRVRLGARIDASLAAVVSCYVVLAGLALRIVGLNTQVALAATGMLVPMLVAGVLAVTR